MKIKLAIPFVTLVINYLLSNVKTTNQAYRLTHTRYVPQSDNGIMHTGRKLQKCKKSIHGAQLFQMAYEQ